MERNISSPVLIEASLEFTERFTCWSIYDNTFYKCITKDKFCSCSISGQAVDSGDSGADLTLEIKHTHVFIRIVSLKNRYTQDFVAVFTDISFHIKWISNIYSIVTQSKSTNSTASTSKIISPTPVKTTTVSNTRHYADTLHSLKSILC